jgi:hypothetical protein
MLPGASVPDRFLRCRCGIPIRFALRCSPGCLYPYSTSSSPSTSSFSAPSGQFTSKVRGRCCTRRLESHRNRQIYRRASTFCIALRHRPLVLSRDCDAHGSRQLSAESNDQERLGNNQRRPSRLSIFRWVFKKNKIARPNPG